MRLHRRSSDNTAADRAASGPIRPARSSEATDEQSAQKSNILHKSQTHRLRLGRKRGSEHHHLLVDRAGGENTLQLSSHVDGGDDVIALVHHEVAQLVHLHPAALDQVFHAARSSYDDSRVGIESLAIGLNVSSSKEDFGSHVRHKLGESFILILDLEGQLTRVSNNQHLNILILRIVLEHLQGGDYEHSSLTHSRLCLTEDVLVGNSTGNASVLH